jgi:hypothetical protein
LAVAVGHCLTEVNKARRRCGWSRPELRWSGFRTLRDQIESRPDGIGAPLDRFAEVQRVLVMPRSQLHGSPFEVFLRGDEHASA